MACRVSYAPSQIQFKVGDADSYFSPNIPIEWVQLPSNGDSFFIINVTNVINPTILFFINGGVLPRNITDDSQISFGVPVDSSQIKINIYNGSQGFQDGQLCIVQFWYITGDIPTPTPSINQYPLNYPFIY